ncbi:MAG: hypothetical protein V3R75_01545 [Alphaproteobacteria bacterium]
MNRFIAVLVLLLVMAITGGVVFLAIWDIPPPQQGVEKVLPNDRFPR